MTTSIQIETHRFILDDHEARRINRRLARLGARLADHPIARALLVLRQRRDRRGFTADLRVQLGPLGPHLLGHRDAPLAVTAAVRAVGAVERQLGRPPAERPGDRSHGGLGRCSPGPPEPL
jgi:hypothetical protein